MRLARGVFKEQDCKFIIRQVLNAIRYLHKGGIAHRDLKPENVLFATGPDLTSRVIVGDLGFARSTASGRMASRVGTDHYMAPEVEYGETHGLSVDIWSLGMIVMFLLASAENAIPNSLIKQNQELIDEWLDSVFGDSSEQETSNGCQRFIRSCLKFKSEHRSTASEAKLHPWFLSQPDKRQFKFLMRETVGTWKPTHIITPPVQELPDLEKNNTAREKHQDSAPRPFNSSTKSRKRNSMDMAQGNSEESPYFAGLKQVSIKRFRNN